MSAHSLFSHREAYVGNTTRRRRPGGRNIFMVVLALLFTFAKYARIETPEFRMFFENLR